MADQDASPPHDSRAVGGELPLCARARPDRPVAATARRAIGSSPRVLLYLFDSKDGLVRALLARARADEPHLLARSARRTGRGHRRAGGDGRRAGVVLAGRPRASRAAHAVGGGLRTVADRPARAVARLRPHDGRGLAGPAACRPTRRRTRHRGGAGRRTAVLAVLRGALLDLLATGDLERTTSAVRHHLRTAQQSPDAVEPSRPIT